MQHLDERFRPCEQVELGQFAVTTAATDAGARAFVVRLLGQPDPASVEAYCADHAARVLALDDGARGRRLLLVYDLTACDASLLTSLRALKPLIDVKTRLKPQYARHLLCSIVVVSDATVASAMNAVLRNAYTPTRPVRIMAAHGEQSVPSVVASLWRRLHLEVRAVRDREDAQ